MIKITFSYDEETNTISDVQVVGAAKKEKAAPKTKKPKKPTGKIILTGNSLKLEQAVLDELGVEVGDRLCVRFNPLPVLVTPEAANEPKGGNLITKSLTVSVRGKTGETMAKFGTEFDYHLTKPGHLNLTSDTSGNMTLFEDTESQDKPESVIEHEEEIGLDDNFDNAVDGGEEVDFVLDI